MGEEMQAEVEKKPKEYKPFTSDWLYGLSFGAYPFSQGDIGIKIEMARIVRDYHGNTTWNMPEEVRKEVVERLSESTERYAKGSKKHPSINSAPGVSDYTADHVVGAFKHVFDGTDTTPGSFEKIFVNAVEQDYKNTVILGGRPGRERTEDNTYDDVAPLKDKHLSFICNYGFLGRPTGFPEYDWMFQESARFGRAYLAGEVGLETITDPDKEKEFRGNFKTLLLHYSKTHPKISGELEGLLKSSQPTS